MRFRHIMANFFLLGFLGSHTALSSTENIYTHKMYRFGSLKNIDSCNQRIKALEKIFEEKTSTTVIGSSCSQISWDPDSLVGEISYKAEKKIDVPRVMSPFHFYETIGVYTSQAQCESDLPKQESLFAKATGLDILSSYCSESEIGSYKSWSFQIDGLGETNIRRFLKTQEFYGMNKPELPADFFDHAKRTINNLGITDIVTIRLKKSLLWYAVVYDFYAEDDLQFTSDENVGYESLSTCQKDLKTASSIFREISPNTLGIYCDNDFPSKLVIASIWRAADTPKTPYQFARFKTGYTSRPLCEGDQEQVRQELVNKGLTPLALFCGYNSGRFTSMGYLKD